MVRVASGEPARVPFQARFLHELIMRSYDCLIRRQEAEWHTLRTTAHFENAILPIGFLPVFPRGTGRAWTESDEGSAQSRPTSIASHGYESNHVQLPTYLIRPASRIGFAGAFSSLFLGMGGHQGGAGRQRF